MVILCGWIHHSSNRVNEATTVASAFPWSRDGATYPGWPPWQHLPQATKQDQERNCMILVCSSLLLEKYLEYTLFFLNSHSLLLPVYVPCSDLSIRQCFGTSLPALGPFNMHPSAWDGCTFFHLATSKSSIRWNFKCHFLQVVFLAHIN